MIIKTDKVAMEEYNFYAKNMFLSEWILESNSKKKENKFEKDKLDEDYKIQPFIIFI